MSSAKSLPRVPPTLLLIAALLLPGIALADGAAPEGLAPKGLPGQLSKVPINHDDPVQSVPPPELGRENPLEWGYVLMDLSHYGDYFFEKREYGKAVKYFLATARMVPDRSVPFSRICASFVGMGDLGQARDACHEALFRTGVKAADFERYLRLLLETRPSLGPDDLEKVDAVFAHLEQQTIESPELQHLRCEIGLRAESVPRVQACVSALTAKWPEDARTITFQWSLALLEKDVAAAEAAVRQARRTRMKPEGIQRMEAATAALRTSSFPPRYLWPAVGGVLASVLAIALVMSLRRSRARAA